jgi:hypothetical protein
VLFQLFPTSPFSEEPEYAVAQCRFYSSQAPQDKVLLAWFNTTPRMIIRR